MIYLWINIIGYLENNWLSVAFLLVITCDLWLEKISRRGNDLLLILGLNLEIKKLAMANNVHRYEHLLMMKDECIISQSIHA